MGEYALEKGWVPHIRSLFDTATRRLKLNLLNDEEAPSSSVLVFDNWMVLHGRFAF